MEVKSALLGSSIVKKYWMALTGLFLCTFLVVHLGGNLILLKGEDARLSFNAYAKFMTTFPLIKAVSYLLYFSILFHAFDGIVLTLQNRAARPVKYYFNKPEANSTWASRNMAFLGTVILIFIVGHMSNFWYKMHFGDIPMDANGNKDLYEVVVTFFKDPSLGIVYVAFYVLCMVALGFHLVHGFASSFQTLGLYHKKYNALIKNLGLVFSVLVPLLFAIIPIFIYIQ
ncbi:succinate dehydrogenase cytochrome b subunit [Schleiferia thermophila]|jgi:succinate dehydrogenase / fumarate reductase cytochrome b subunit|uniref:Succinate dehydrogenase / fumarate reductase cytochrome b subunit n=1 Tax=Schleiferia thermophila TaxID=884107 RepID=A0A369AAH5_9FLAO|nr:succinate dehydrogenase cytochrome b subunit [Schleiferia thermophila]PMB40060.1 succinate dehydrogenase [Fischerella thermalis CCMEE 5319]RCX05398.1 succinate dehydrogenase / fumarate reductase cytochrome b subunit [Schleiferia thermophila]GCD79096.1 succinate dehydrogenase [Schleiferia thermophila]